MPARQESSRIEGDLRQQQTFDKLGFLKRSIALSNTRETGSAAATLNFAVPGPRIGMAEGRAVCNILTLSLAYLTSASEKCHDATGTRCNDRGEGVEHAAKVSTHRKSMRQRVNPAKTE